MTDITPKQTWLERSIVPACALVLTIVLCGGLFSVAWLAAADLRHQISYKHSLVMRAN